jgi:peptidoglycan/xylan/chitin deacetylase (PgdA/CDA1 family)
LRRIILLFICLLTACSQSPPPTNTTATTPVAPIPSPAQPVSKPPAPLKEQTPPPVVTQPPARYVLNTKTFQITNPDSPKEKILLLTFDDGPTGVATMRLLEILDRHQAKSIWFINGHQVAKKDADKTYTLIPEKAALLREIHKRGHLVGNHTWWHENLRTLSSEKQREEILSTSKLIEDVLGEKPKYFRPPFGASTPLSDQICREQGMVSVNWSVGSLDWEASVYQKPNGITKQVISTVHKGGNILFHDRVWTADELDAILTRLEHEGYRFVLPTEAK